MFKGCEVLASCNTRQRANFHKVLEESITSCYRGAEGHSQAILSTGLMKHLEVLCVFFPLLGFLLNVTNGNQALSGPPFSQSKEKSPADCMVHPGCQLLAANLWLALAIQPL